MAASAYLPGRVQAGRQGLEGFSNGPQLAAMERRQQQPAPKPSGGV